MIRIIIICILLCGTAQAEDKNKWTTTDTALQVTYTVLHVMDWSQTLHIARNPTTNAEKGAIPRHIIGPHPSEGRVNSFLAVGLIAHTAISIALPKKVEILGMNIPARNLWQLVWIGIEQDAVRHNIRTGIKISF